jgi:toxin CcdB
MSQYDVYKGYEKDTFILDVQSDILSDLNTRMVVPLLPEQMAPEAAQRLNPILEVEGIKCVMVTQFMTAVPKSELKSHIANVSGHAFEITNALDMLFQGF